MKRTILTFVMMALTIAVMAVPAKKGQWKTLKLNDGTEVRATLVGDEHGHFWKADNGKVYQKVAGTEVYKAVDELAVIAKAKVRRSKVNAKRVQRRTFGHPTTITGKKKAIMILVNFSDVKYQTGHDNALFQNIANAENYNQPPFMGSMADYFKAQSRGKFELDFDVVGPVTVSKKQSYYGQNDSDDKDMHPEEMVAEAVSSVKSQVSDWSVYDWDSDGYVDQVYVVYAGKGEADGGAEETIWPHAWELGYDAVTVGTNLKVNSYACGPELNGTTGDINGIGVMCHEYSHCLGYPDFYDIDYSGGQGMGAWDLMDQGSYNGDSYVPAGYTSYERWFAGWETPVVLGAENVEVRNMKSLQNGGEFYIIYNDKNENEYYLLENRQLEGWDAEAPGAGLLILHCDYDASVWEQNAPNDDPNHQRFIVVSANGKYPYEIWQGDRYFDDSEPFPYGSVNAFNKSFKMGDNIAKRCIPFYTKTSNGTKWMNGSVEEIIQNSDNTVDFNFVASYEGGAAVDEVSYAKVTENSQLVAGNEYVLINEANEVGNGGFKDKYLLPVEVLIDGTTATGDELVPMKLGGSTGSYSLAIEGKYLTATQTKQLKLSDTESKIWNITSTANGYVVKSDSYGTVQYNASTPRFMNYTSNQRPAVLYVKQTTTGIQNVQRATATVQRIFTLDGRYVGTDVNALSHGLYIVNGKKVVK